MAGQSGKPCALRSRAKQQTQSGPAGLLNFHCRATACLVRVLLLNMKWPRVKLLMFTSRLPKAYAFYSALGMEWQEGGPVEFGATGYPLYMEKSDRPSCRPGIETGIPELI